MINECYIYIEKFVQILKNAWTINTLHFGSKFYIEYCKLDPMYILKSWFLNCKSATAVNLLYFECKYCLKVKGTANWMFCIHWKVFMNVVQNAPTVNLPHFGYQYCGKVTDSINWMFYLHWKVCINIVLNTLTVNLQHFGSQYCKLDVMFALKSLQ